MAKARLREDRVALRVLRDLDEHVAGAVPASHAVLFTLGAPLKVPAQLVVVLAETLRAYLRTGAAEKDVKRTLLGNRVRFRVLRGGAGLNARLIGFVFTGDPRPAQLAAALAALRTAPPLTSPLGSGAEAIADPKTYRRLASFLAPSAQSVL